MRHLPPCDRFLNLAHIEIQSDITRSSDVISQSFTKQCNNVTLEVGKFLGSGGFGSVFEGRCLGRKVALKRIRHNQKNPHAVAESYMAEKVAMSLRHRNVVRVIGTTEARTSCEQIRPERLIVMEYAGSRNLLSIINDESEEITTCRRLKFASDIANALCYIHKQNVAHLDVKPANIIVSHRNQCKLGDFGCCKVLPESGVASPTTPTNSYLTGTLAYRSPELLKGDYPTCSADIYSYGICLWQLLCREKPYGNDNMYVVIFGVVSYDLRPDITPDMEQSHGEYVRLVRRCWRSQPEQRPHPRDVIIKLCAIKTNSITAHAQSKGLRKARWKL